MNQLQMCGGNTMWRPWIVACLVGTAAVVAVSVGAALAQDCEAMAAGPARTDCLIGRARIEGQKSGIATTTSQQRANASALKLSTGGSASARTRKTRPKHRAKGQ